MSCLCRESTTFQGISQHSATVPCCSTLRAGLLLASISCTRIGVLTESQTLSGRLPMLFRRQPADPFFRELLVSLLVSNPLADFLHSEQKKGAQYVNLRAEPVDVPATSGTCDPRHLLSDETFLKLSDTNALFLEESLTRRATGPSRRDRSECISLTARQLTSGTVRFYRKVHSCAGVFAVGKSRGRQLAVWNGSSISEAAALPPTPPRLANP